MALEDEHGGEPPAPYFQGRRAYYTGDTNPFTPVTSRYVEWDLGFRDAQQAESATNE